MNLRIWAALVGAAIGWGTGGVGTRAALNAGVSPFGLMAMRILIAAVVLGVVLTARGHRWYRGQDCWRVGSVLSLLNLIVPVIFFTLAVQHASAGFVGLLVALVPIVTAVGAHYLLPDEPLHASKIVALAIGFAGIGLLLGSGDTGLASGGRPVLAVSFAGIGILAIGLANIYAKRRATTYDPMALTAVQFVVGVVLLSPLTLLIEGVPSAISAWGWMLIIYLSLGSMIMPYVLFYWVLRHISSTRASTIGYLVPVVTVFAGVLLLDERLEAGIVLAGLVILTGVVLSHRAERSPVAT